MAINGVDKALLDRAARLLDGLATVIEKQTGGVWGGSGKARKAKVEHDRLRRDAFDLRALAKRLQRTWVAASGDVGLVAQLRVNPAPPAIQPAAEGG